jgi:hypothetical protein
MGGATVSINERLAFLLGRELSLPVAEVQGYDVPDPGAFIPPGIISIEDNRHWGQWQDLEGTSFFRSHSDYARSCRSLITNLSQLREAVVFDIWIRNSDRHYRNILVNEVVERRQYQAVLIDHSHAFCHHDGSLADRFMSELETGDADFLHPHEKDLARQLVDHRCQFEDVLARVEALPDERLEDLVAMAVANYPPATFRVDSAHLLEGLIARRKRLPEAVTRLCNELGIAC